MRLEPDLIYQPNFVTPQSLPKNKTQNNSTSQNAFHNLFQITCNIFEETVIDNLKPKKSTRKKGKDILKKKNTTGLVQDDRELVKKGEKNKVLEV